jgi:hypothetical protein
LLAHTSNALFALGSCILVIPLKITGITGSRV